MRRRASVIDAARFVNQSRDRRSPVTSRRLRQQERGADALVAVFMIEGGEEDAVHRGAFGKDAHGPGSSPDFAEAALDGVGGSHSFAPGPRLVAPAGEQLI